MSSSFSTTTRRPRSVPAYQVFLGGAASLLTGRHGRELPVKRSRLLRTAWLYLDLARSITFPAGRSPVAPIFGPL